MLTAAVSRMIRCCALALLVSGIAVVLAPAAHAGTVSYSANFAVDDVDPWGGSGVDRAHQAYSVRWDEDGYTSDLEEWAGMEFGGSIGGATSGVLGVDFAYDAQLGTLDIDYPALVDVSYPEDETYFPGDTIRISTSNRSTAGSFDFDPGAQTYEVDGTLGLSARASGELCFVECFGTIPFFPPFSTGEQQVDLLTASAGAGEYGDIWDPPAGSGATHVTGDVNIRRPDMQLDVAEQGRMQAVSQQPFLHADVDVDAFSKTPLGRSFSAEGMALSYDVLDGRLNLDGDETHTLDFRPTVRMTYALPRAMTYRVVSATGTVGPAQSGTTVTMAAGESIDLTLPTDMTQPFTLTPTLTLTNTVQHRLDHVYQVQGTLKVLRASAGLPSFTVIPEICVDFGELGEACTPALEFPGLSLGIGPVFQQSIPVATTRPTLFDRTWSVPFAPAAQDPRAFDPENMPVAVAGGPYQVQEGSSITLDGTGSFDLDADDTLTYAWVLDAVGSLTGTDVARPTFAGLDGEQAYVATLTVCDLKRNCTSDTATVQVHNVVPAHVLDTSTTITFGVGQAFLARNGVAMGHVATATDAGTDDTTYAWSAGAASTWTPATTTYFNDGVAADARPSAFGTLPFSTADATSVTYTQPGVQALQLVVSDDDGGSTTTTAPVLIADSSTTVRSYGWFKQQYSLQGRRELTTTQLDAYLAFTRAGSRVFDERVALATSAHAYAVLQRLDDRTSTTSDQVRAFTLTAWLNVASGAVAFEGPLPSRLQQPGRTTNAQALRAIEAVLLDPAATKQDLLGAMQLAQAIS